jgi:HK97 gp10 family phage protein
MKSTVKIVGLSELDAALGELPKAIAKGVLRRVLKKAGQPIADAAKENAPVDTGKLRNSIMVSSKIRNTIGKAEFAEAMRSGDGTDAAVAAMRNARRSASADGSFVDMYVGPSGTLYAHMVEFGSVHNTPHPFMRPAWDAHQDDALSIIKDSLGTEIMKAAKRLAARRAKAAAKVG